LSRLYALVLPVLAVFSAVPDRPAFAQRASADPPTAKCGQDLPVSAPSCQKEFAAWQAREKRWRENRRLYANYVSYEGMMVPYVERPDPPVWLGPYCAREQAVSTMGFSIVCDAYDEYQEYDWAAHIDGPQAAVTYSTKVLLPGKREPGGFVDYLLKNVHFDGPWTNGSSGPRVYGLLGTHLTLARAGRIYFWGPPGVLLLRHPTGEVQVRMTWGIDIFVGDVPVPFGAGFKVPIYFSIAKAFGKNEQQAIERGVNAGLDMLGFSVTLKR